MAYLTIGATEYLVQVGQARGRRVQVEQRRRAIDGSLLLDTITDKVEAQVTVTGATSAGRFFTPAEADAFMDTLSAGDDLSVSGDLGTFTASARDIGWVDVSDHRTSPPSVYRHVSFTLEEI